MFNQDSLHNNRVAEFKKVGAVVTFGHYEQDGTKSGKEKIEWLVLKNDGDKSFLIKAVYDLFSGRYNIRKVEKERGDNYRVFIRDGHVIKVKVGKKTNIFGEKRSFIKYVDD